MSINFPNHLTPAAHATITVRYPIECVPDWPHPPGKWDRCPSSFPELYTLPDPLEHPALDATALDCMRVTNIYLHHCGLFPNDTTVPFINAKAAEWRAAPANTDTYPFPPDPRIL
jgi:hypothetical protein